MSRTLRVRQSQTVVPFGVGAVFDIQGDVFLVGATATPTVKYTNLPRTIGIELTKQF